MKNFVLPIALFTILFSCKHAQKINKSDSTQTENELTNSNNLVRANEEVLFSFKLIGGKKKVALCVEKSNKYLVYRFGNDNHIELQYPTVLDNTSWKLFNYSGYSRGGGAKNDALESHSISFVNNGITYKMYDNVGRGEGEGKDAGILITINKKLRDLKADTSSEKGTIGSLRDYQNLISNNYNEEE
jgi:hypothetical protein